MMGLQSFSHSPMEANKSWIQLTQEKEGAREEQKNLRIDLVCFGSK